MIERTSLFNAFESIQEERGARPQHPHPGADGPGCRCDGAQLGWLMAELRRRKALADGLVIELDARAAAGRPGAGRGAAASCTTAASRCRCRSRRAAWPCSNACTTPRCTCCACRTPPSRASRRGAFATLMAPWRERGRGLIVDHVRSIDAVSRLWDLGIDFLQGDALAATGPRLDYDFEQ